MYWFIGISINWPNYNNISVILVTSNIISVQNSAFPPHKKHSWWSTRGQALLWPESWSPHRSCTRTQNSPWVVVVVALGVEDVSVGASLHARSRLLCCLASCSMVSSRWVRCSLSYCSARCHLLLWVSARSKKSRQAWSKGTQRGAGKFISTSLRNVREAQRCLPHTNQGQFWTINMES